MRTCTTDRIGTIVSKFVSHRHALTMIAFMSCLVQVTLADSAQAQCRQARLTANDGEDGDLFGYSVSVDGDIAVVGALLDEDTGSAYVHERNAGGLNDWGQVAKLTADDAAMDDFFGVSVSVSGDVVVVGAYGNVGNGNDSGAAYVFQRDAGGPGHWGQVTKLTADDAAAAALFGYSVSISGDVAIVGAYFDEHSGEGRPGSAYVFDRNAGGPDNWGQVARLTADDAADGDEFGWSVSLSGGVAVVGADRSGTGGSAYVFERNAGGPDNWGQVTKLTADDGGGAFGRAVSVDNGVILVGSPFNSAPDSSSGAAYVFERNTGGVDNWGQVTKLTASDGVAFDNFGSSVSVNGGVAIVGSFPGDQVGAGAAYVFDRNFGGPDNWGEVAKFTSDDSETMGQFGRSVSISGEVVVVGATDAAFGLSPGLAYLFLTSTNCCPTPAPTACQQVKITPSTSAIGIVAVDGDILLSWRTLYRQLGGDPSTWSEVTMLTGNDTESSDSFGVSGSISGDVTVVGAWRDDDAGANSGSAYVFERNAGGPDNWGQVVKLTADDGAAGDNFGAFVSISGDVAVVSASRDDDVGADSGSAYVFERNAGARDNWGQVKKLTADDGAGDDRFGFSVSVSGDFVVIGALQDDDAGSESGSAYIFERNAGGANNWGQVKKLTASDAEAGDKFGDSVSADGNFVIVGAPVEGGGIGAAYVFERNTGGPDNWGEVRKLTANDFQQFGFFGDAVSIKGDLVIVGAVGDADGAFTGSAYLFERNAGGPDNWGEVRKLAANDAAANNWFGFSVALQDDLVAVVGTLTPSSYVFLNASRPDCGSCPGDLNGNERADGEDIQMFLDCVMTGLDCECSDMDGDCRTADMDFTDDVAAFVNRLLP